MAIPCRRGLPIGGGAGLAAIGTHHVRRVPKVDLQLVRICGVPFDPLAEGRLQGCVEPQFYLDELLLLLGNRRVVRRDRCAALGNGDILLPERDVLLCGPQNTVMPSLRADT